MTWQPYERPAGDTSPGASFPEPPGPDLDDEDLLPVEADPAPVPAELRDLPPSVLPRRNAFSPRGLARVADHVLSWLAVAFWGFWVLCCLGVMVLVWTPFLDFDTVWGRLAATAIVLLFAVPGAVRGWSNVPRRDELLPARSSRWAEDSLTVTAQRLVVRKGPARARVFERPADGRVTLVGHTLRVEGDARRLDIGEISLSDLRAALQRHGWTLLRR